jgi:hypothetical protein
LAPIAVLAGFAPQLYWEGKASVLATKHLMEEQGNKEGLKNSLKALAPGFLSYLAIPAVMGGVVFGGNRLIRKMMLQATRPRA